MKKKTIKIACISSLETTLATKERFNAYMGGYGVHKTPKHPNRASSKMDIKKQITQY